MKFISDAMAKSLMASHSITHVVRKSLSGKEKARSHEKVHASDVTKPDFCPRKIALLDLTESKLPDFHLTAALKATFDLGNAVADLVREKWLGDAAVGNWECVRCHAVKTFTSKPSPTKSDCLGKSHIWKFVEPAFVSDKYGIHGSIDVFVRLGGAKLFVTELKIIAAEEFDKIVGPLSEHRLRTALYLKLIDESSSVWKSSIHTGEAKVFYVSRGHGRKHPDFGEVLPFREFTVHRADEALAPMLEKAKAIHDFRSGGPMPSGICSSFLHPTAKKCPMKTQCFSPQFPAGKPFKIPVVSG